MNSSDGVDEMDVASLAEAYDLECKAAQGRDGRGELPDDVWKSYSAMANADGGVILLGVQEKPRGSFRALGLADVERVRKALWDNLHNRKQVSVNLLTEQDVDVVQIDDHMVLRVRVPRASRQQRPVHVGSNPFGGTYLRRYEGDYQADDEAVRRMVAAGGQMLSEVHGNSRYEDTPGNASVYARAPWGTLIELQSIPGGYHYPQDAEAEVWLPPRRDVGQG